MASMSPVALSAAAVSLYDNSRLSRKLAPRPDFMSSTLVPGALVRHPERPDWGLGQVQSVVGSRITVNFENAGKLLINGDVILLEAIDFDGGPSG
jgi:hypothetical protein